MVEPTTIIAASGIVGDAYRGLKDGSLQLCRWMARKQGLVILKKLPMGLEALVFGHDLSPELLAALSLGGKPGIKLSTLALMHTTDWGLRKNVSFEAYLTNLLEDKVAPLPPGIQEETRMNDDLHKVELLDGQPVRDVRVASLSQPASCPEASGTRVVGFISPERDFTRGLIVYSPGDDCFWYCENRFGVLKCSTVDVCPNNDARLDVKAANKSSRVFSVNPATLASYAEFDRIFNLLNEFSADVLQLLGLAKVAEDLGVNSAKRITRGGCGLLSMDFLKKVHGLHGDNELLQIPDDIKSRATQAGQALSLSDRVYEKTRFRSMRETITAFLEEVESKAKRRGNVGCQPYEKSTTSLLIKSCILDSLREKRTFTIFKGFKKFKLNIAVSSGSVAIYFQGLNFSVAFPEGSGALKNASFKASCPFLPDLSLTLPILVDLAPKIGKGRLTKVATVLSEELAADPSLALSPLTREVLRSFSTMEMHKYLLSKLLSVTTGTRRHSEAAIGGVLCQLGVDFTLAGNSSPDMRCYFDRCHEVDWGRSRGTVGEVVVDCPINIEGCMIYPLTHGSFLATDVPGDREMEKKCAKITGALSRKLLEECLETDTILLEAITSELVTTCIPRPIPVPCYVG
ncbi:unnamed protein product [Ascophyllum nodosum]